jgi:hypothetical protein
MAWAGAQERASVVSAVPHILRGRDHPRQAFNAFTFLGLQLLAPAVESGRQDDPLHQGRRIGRAAVDVARNSAERGLGQPGLHLLLELFDRGNPSTKTQNLGDLARLHHGCIHADNCQLQLTRLRSVQPVPGGAIRCNCFWRFEDSRFASTS